MDSSRHSSQKYIFNHEKHMQGSHKYEILYEFSGYMKIDLHRKLVLELLPLYKNTFVEWTPNVVN